MSFGTKLCLAWVSLPKEPNGANMYISGVHSVDWALTLPICAYLRKSL